jgi:hypothetical protein
VDGRRCEGPDRHKERGAGGTWKFSMGFVWYIYAKHVSPCINLKP